MEICLVISVLINIVLLRTVYELWKLYSSAEDRYTNCEERLEIVRVLNADVVRKLEARNVEMYEKYSSLRKANIEFIKSLQLQIEDDDE